MISPVPAAASGSIVMRPPMPGEIGAVFAPSSTGLALISTATLSWTCCDDEMLTELITSSLPEKREAILLAFQRRPHVRLARQHHATVGEPTLMLRRTWRE